ncbi:MAG: hypothetical protein IPP88_12980, partial [Betaproteobacteria bacterium]|nr:hypothetical protein [Betaproteobacteria bacterium]
MNSFHAAYPARLAGTGLLLLALTGCASLSRDGGFATVERVTKERTGADVKWVRAESERDSLAARVSELLAKPLSADDAVQVALLNNRGLQADFAELTLANEETVRYARKVREVAAASAELARRMASVGNWSRLQQAREQGFYADAAHNLARAEQARLHSREALTRLLGLFGSTNRVHIAGAIAGSAKGGRGSTGYRAARDAVAARCHGGEAFRRISRVKPGIEQSHAFHQRARIRCNARNVKRGAATPWVRNFARAATVRLGHGR